MKYTLQLVPKSLLTEKQGAWESTKFKTKRADVVYECPRDQIQLCL